MQMLSLSSMIGQISVALDAVEADLLGATPYHSKRVAVLSLAMGRLLGYDGGNLFCLAGSALLHDNALTEYILSERPGEGQRLNLKTHCVIGQKNADYFPFPGSTAGFILYHHENADGTGAFGKREGEYPREAAVIALADQIDVRFRLQRLEPAKLDEVKRYIRENTGSLYGKQEAEAALSALDKTLLESVKDDRIFTTLHSQMPDVTEPMSNQDLINLSRIVAKIIDYKSAFTRLHSTQIANKAWHMSGVYGYRQDERAALYTAAAMHDVGKLFIPNSILEKPGKLDEREFGIIKSHVWKTWEILSPVKGLEQIALWAANHHEKLDGTGYPWGKTKKELDFNSRLLACLDIYQAVREERPYHPVRSHQDTMKVLYSMAQAGFIEPVIVADLDREMAVFPDGYAPEPTALPEPELNRADAAV